MLFACAADGSLRSDLESAPRRKCTLCRLKAEKASLDARLLGGEQLG